ncbi:MAG: acyl-CoA dehydrogenase family protein [Gammaproteobacteria bacterium]|nr:acyl-CoA dehydrogenase family protein [Gammaproteobacteria bacterium]
MRNPFETEEHSAFREQVRKFVETEMSPYVDQWEEDGEIPWELHQKVGAMGVFGFGIDEKYGGLGFEDCIMRAIFAEEVNKCGSSGPPAAVGGRSISVGPIAKLAREEIKLAVLPEVLCGNKGSSLAITEPSGGSDVARIKTQAKQDGSDWILNGSKAFITGGMRSDYFVVAARTSGTGLQGISLFLVEGDAVGFDRTLIERKMGWWSSDTASLYFDNVRLPKESLLGHEGTGFLQIVNNFNFERFSMVAGMLGMMKRTFDDAVAWAKERDTFGKPLIQHQVIRHKLADMSAKIDMIQSYLYQLAHIANTGEMPVAEICKAKFAASKALEFCCSEGMQILGGAGYLRGHSIERYYREVKVQAIGGGSEEIMRDLAMTQMGF